MSKGLSLSKSGAAAIAPRFVRVAAPALRLSVHRSGKHIYAQVIDDEKGTTVAFGLDPGGGWGGTSPTLPPRPRSASAWPSRQGAGVTQVVFDRGGFLFHGRVKALAEAAREAGLEF